jgi:hypothetical protein
MAAASYLHNIPSVHNINPGVPVVLGHLDLNRRIEQGDPVIRDNLMHARAVASALRGLKGRTLT